MSVQLNPYLNFRDDARQAMESYHSVFGGTLDVATFEGFGAAQDPAEKGLVMHAQLRGTTASSSWPRTRRGAWGSDAGRT